MMEKAKGNTKTSSSFGLGHDGQARAKLLAGGNGSGAEQVCESNSFCCNYN
jgi:hypothetical protein